MIEMMMTMRMRDWMMRNKSLMRRMSTRMTKVLEGVVQVRKGGDLILLMMLRRRMTRRKMRTKRMIMVGEEDLGIKLRGDRALSFLILRLR